ncbi:Hypothetical_protein [Hexamita inflata]|uniref:Hypothetical_protein n=1 Tax=Hexamita inflata TaxID=28002 RepID=A0AA86R3F0_9EUKA|nr:Hypothetical protein HINF_LOCUS56232 [Hexamita inflata]
MSLVEKFQNKKDVSRPNSYCVQRILLDDPALHHYVFMEFTIAALFACVLFSSPNSGLQIRICFLYSLNLYDASMFIYFENYDAIQPINSTWYLNHSDMDRLYLEMISNRKRLSRTGIVAAVIFLENQIINLKELGSLHFHQPLIGFALFNIISRIHKIVMQRTESEHEFPNLEFQIIILQRDIAGLSIQTSFLFQNFSTKLILCPADLTRK